ncbi:MAG: CHAT domain-containing protein, partial [Terriglobales bacterium]
TEHGRKIRELREELNWFFHMTEKAQVEQASRQQLSALRADSQRRERELLKLSREHGSADDRAQEAQLVSSFTIDEVRQSVPADTVLLDYFQVRDQMVVLLLRHDRLEIVPLGELPRIATALDLLQLQLSKLRLGPEYVEQFAGVLLQATQTHLHELYKLLVEPIRDLLNARHLVVAPYGILHQLPFHALFDGRQYLIDEFTVSYAPSASVYALCQQRSAGTTSRSSGRGALVLGIPDPAVPFVAEEVEAVATSLPGSEVLLGEEATVERLREHGPSSRFIHIATHGHFRQDNPMFSGIKLGDSYLSLYDLYQLKLPAELIALSGCSTGLNVVAAGDELLGLARGLIHAGAETSMLTLWDVQDQSSAQLMKLFYSNLAGGADNKAAALQRAMRELKSERPHPYHWAPFVLMGKG